MNRLIPYPVFFIDASAIRPGEDAWKVVELIPAKKIIIPSTYGFGARPSKDIKVAVIAGVNITKYLAPALSAIYPTNGLSIEGILAKVVNKPAEVRDREKASII